MVRDLWVAGHVDAVGRGSPRHVARSHAKARVPPSSASEELLGEGVLDPLLVALRRPASVSNQVAIDLGDRQRRDDGNGVVLRESTFEPG